MSFVHRYRYPWRLLRLLGRRCRYKRTKNSKEVLRQQSQNIYARKASQEKKMAEVCLLHYDGSSAWFPFQDRQTMVPTKICQLPPPEFVLPDRVKVILTKKQDSPIKIDYTGDGNKFLEVSRQEFLTYDGDLAVSIAQMSLPQGEVKLPKAIQNYFTMLQSSSQINLIRAINLWYYRGDRISTWHYDGHDNFLYLLAGTKVVYLLPPDHNDAVLQAKIVFSLDNNHSKGEMPKQLYQDNHAMLRAELHGSECLFIPRGWWHQVQSFGDTNIAVNVWGNSLLHSLRLNEQYIALKQLVLEISERICEKNIDKWHEISEDKRQMLRAEKFATFWSQFML